VPIIFVTGVLRHEVVHDLECALDYYIGLFAVSEFPTLFTGFVLKRSRYRVGHSGPEHSSYNGTDIFPTIMSTNCAVIQCLGDSCLLCMINVVSKCNDADRSRADKGVYHSGVRAIILSEELN